MKPILGTSLPSQIAVICKDIEATKRCFAGFLDMEVPPTLDGGEYSVTQCMYRGKPAETQGCKMAFFQLGPIELEMIEPYGGESVWQDFLDETGGGLHHIAFQIPDIDEGIKKCEEYGMTLLQKGFYGDSSGAYAYMDARNTLSCFVELLCSFPRESFQTDKKHI